MGMSAPTPAQHAAIEALKTGESFVQAMVAEYNLRRQTIVSGLNQIGLPTFEPKGAFYAFPDVRPTGLSSDEFAERLLMEHKVAVVPGHAFGPSGDGHVRCAYTASHSQIEEALDRIETFVKQNKK